MKEVLEDVTGWTERGELVAVATRGRRKALGPAGAMGGRRAQERRRESLLEGGLDVQRLDRLAAPFGLYPGAARPEETALSIMGVAVRHGRDPRRLSHKTGGRIHEVGA